MSRVQQILTEEQHIERQLRNTDDVVLNALDFAGQGAYYASHQTYIRENAIYVLVFDASRELDQKKEVPPDGSWPLFSNWTQKGKYRITLAYFAHIYANLKR